MKNLFVLSNKFQVVPICITVLLGIVLGNFVLFLSPILAYKKTLIFVIPIISVFFVFLLIKPKVVFWTLLFIRPVVDLVLDTTKIVLGGTQLSAGAGLNLAIIILGLFWGTRASCINGRENPFNKYWLFYLLFIFIAISHTPYFGTGIRLLINNLTYFAMYTIPLVLIKTRDDFKFFLKIIGASLVLPVVFGNIDVLFWGGRYFPDSGQRIAGSFAHPNILAFFMAFGMIIYFVILQSNLFKFTRGTRLLIKGLMLNMFLLLLATKTRNAWLACFICFSLYGLLRDKRLLTIILICLPLAFFIPSVKQRVMNAIDSSVAVDYQGLNSFDWRLEMWKGSITLIKERPWFGYGLTSFKPMTAKFSDVGENGAHNVYLELMFEAGIGGLLSFLFLLVAPAVWFFQKMRLERDPIVSRLFCISGSYMVSYALVCTADNMLYYLALNWYIWFFVGMMVAGYPFLRGQRNA